MCHNNFEITGTRTAGAGLLSFEEFLEVLSLSRRILLLSAAVVTASVWAQQAERRPLPAGPVGPIVIGDKKYYEAYVTPDPEGPTLHCVGPGMDCVMNARLFMPRSLSSSHDATLQETSAAINRILESLNPPPGRRLCLYRSAAGPVLLWAAAGPPRAGVPAPPRGTAGNFAANNARIPPGAISDSRAIANALGLRRTNGGNRLAKVIWDEHGHSYFTCPNPGTDCEIRASFALVTARTPSHDGTLAEATQQINSILERAQSRAPRPDRTICLFWSPEGPVLIWTSLGTVSGRVSEPGSPEYQKALGELLGR